MTQTALFACRGVHDDRWQLGEPPDGRAWTLIGWQQKPPSLDAGVPHDVAAVLAAALSAVARVTFPSSSEQADAASDWSPRDRHDVRLLSSGGVTASIRAALKGTPRDMVLVSTRNPDAIVRLFDDAAYPWWMQGTFSLLSAPDGRPPDLEWTQAVALLSGPSPSEMESLLAAVHGLLKPGVDGDVAGLLMQRPDLDARLLEALGRECGIRAIGWAVVSEDELVDRLA